jgi:ABC-type lipoprotein release transport system permease subunit
MPDRTIKNGFLTPFKVGLFLAIREIKRASIWTTLLIILIMILTFLNLIVVTGVLVGLVDGISQSVKGHYAGDLMITKFYEKRYIEGSQDIIRFVKSLPDVQAVTWRYTSGATIEANYKDKKRQTDITESAGGVAAGIDPVAEDNFGDLSKLLVAGTYLEPDDYDQIIVGVNLLYNYTPVESTDLRTLKNVDVGSKVRVRIGTTTREMTIKGVVKSKVDTVDQRIFMTDSQLRKIINRDDYNVNEIAIRLKPGVDPIVVKSQIVNAGYDRFAQIKTFEEGKPKFVEDIENTFALLGNMISSIGLAVACITIFIVIFVNAITRRRYIGILKGIGISSRAIEFSYAVQSLFYAFCGMIIGSIIIYGFLSPYIAAHPIDFPFSDGTLVVPISGTLLRAGILFIATIIAGYIPARIVVNQNTLDAILGR